MSFESMAWAVKQPCKSAGQKLVLLLLANHTNGHTGQCNPSHRLLAEECCMGVSTLKTHLQSLAEQGLIRIIRKSQDGVDLPNQYALCSGSGGRNLAGEGSESGRGEGSESGYKTGTIKPGIEPTPIVPKGTTHNHRRVREEKTMTEWLESLQDTEDAISQDDPIFTRGIPSDMIETAWHVFRDRYTNDTASRSKRYKDWRQTFRNAIDANWLKLWWIDGSGAYQLTTAGKQAAARFGG